MTYPSKLNLGCGTRPLDDHYNVDLEPGEGVDLVADIRTLTLPDESFEEILLQDVIEHFTFLEAKDVLCKCFGWLEDGGGIYITTQNLRVLAYNLSMKDCHESLMWIYGADGSLSGKESLFHRWAYSSESLTALLEEIGYVVHRVYFDCKGFRLCVTAKK